MKYVQFQYFSHLFQMLFIRLGPGSGSGPKIAAGEALGLGLPRALAGPLPSALGWTFYRTSLILLNTNNSLDGQYRSSWN